MPPGMVARAGRFGQYLGPAPCVPMCLLNQQRTALNANKLHLWVCLRSTDGPGTRSRGNVQHVLDRGTISLFGKCLPALLEGRQIEVEQAWQRTSLLDR